jgi:hypothetical protein
MDLPLSNSHYLRSKLCSEAAAQFNYAVNTEAASAARAKCGLSEQDVMGVV